MQTVTQSTLKRYLPHFSFRRRTFITLCSTL